MKTLLSFAAAGYMAKTLDDFSLLFRVGSKVNYSQRSVASIILVCFCALGRLFLFYFASSFHFFEICLHVTSRGVSLRIFS